MIFDPNHLYDKMWLLIRKHNFKQKLIIGNEGSSRSSKTFDDIHLIVDICDSSRGTPLDIYFFRDTMVSCEENLMKDFIDCLSKMKIYDERNFRYPKGKVNYNLFGQTIRFRGMDDGSINDKEPPRSDIIYINEALSGIEEDKLKGWIMRCEKLVLMDWNPRYTDHFIFDYQQQDNCTFIHSTYKQNKHLPQSVVDGIEKYCPWELGAWTEDGWTIPVEERNPNKENIRQKTVDKFRWAVYGEGVRANKEGLVFPHVTWIESFPKDVDQIGYGCDFGETAQTAIVKLGMRKRKDGKGKDDLFLKKLFYAPTENSDIVLQVMKSLNIPEHIWCDNNMPGWISDLRRGGIQALATKKFPGSRAYWITSIKQFNIHIVKDPDFRKEQENFSYRVVDGKQLSETIKKFDHLMSATGYGVVGDFRLRE